MDKDKASLKNKETDKGTNRYSLVYVVTITMLVIKLTGLLDISYFGVLIPAISIIMLQFIAAGCIVIYHLYNDKDTDMLNLIGWSITKVTNFTDVNITWTFITVYTLLECLQLAEHSWTMWGIVIVIAVIELMMKIIKYFGTDEESIAKAKEKMHIKGE